MNSSALTYNKKIFENVVGLYITSVLSVILLDYARTESKKSIASQ